MLSPIGDLKYPIGYNTSNWGLEIHESGNAKSENKSPIPYWIKLKYPIGDTIPDWRFSSVSPLLRFK